MQSPNLLDQLEMFVIAAELGSFAATAKKLGRAQNVISYGISNLEEYLQVTLFDRSGHKATLSAEGQALKLKALSILNGSLELSRQASELAAGMETVLTIALDDLVPLSVINPALEAVSKKYPALEIRLNRTAGTETYRLVNQNIATLGITTSQIGLNDSHQFSLISMVELIPVVSTEVYTRAQQSFGSFEHTSIRQIVLSSSSDPEATPDQGVFSRNIWRVLDLRSKNELIHQGFGWGSMPAHLVEKSLQDNRLTKLSIPQFSITPELHIALFSNVQTALGPAAQLFYQSCTASKHNSALLIKRPT